MNKLMVRYLINIALTIAVLYVLALLTGDPRIIFPVVAYGFWCFYDGSTRRDLLAASSAQLAPPPAFVTPPRSEQCAHPADDRVTNEDGSQFCISCMAVLPAQSEQQG